MTTAARADGDRATGRRVGEVTAATGLTVRTLHYYGEIGLLVASKRTDAGHRMYGDREYSARDSEGHLWSFMKLLD